MSQNGNLAISQNVNTIEPSHVIKNENIIKVNFDIGKL